MLISHQSTHPNPRLHLLIVYVYVNVYRNTQCRLFLLDKDMDHFLSVIFWTYIIKVIIDDSTNIAAVLLYVTQADSILFHMVVSIM